MKADNTLVLESAGVEIRVLYRHGQWDEGWTFHVFSKTPQVEILRFDVLRKVLTITTPRMEKRDSHDDQR